MLITFHLIWKALMFNKWKYCDRSLKMKNSRQLAILQNFHQIFELFVNKNNVTKIVCQKISFRYEIVFQSLEKRKIWHLCKKTWKWWEAVFRFSTTRQMLKYNKKKLISRVQGGNNKGERTIAPFLKKKKSPPLFSLLSHK